MWKQESFTLPSLPFWTTSFAFTFHALFTIMWSTVSESFFALATLFMAFASATLVAAGFSTITCLPAFRAAIASFACVALFVATYTASIDLSAKIASAESYHVRPSASAAALRAGFTSVAPTSTAFLSGAKRLRSHANPSFATRFSAMPPKPINAYFTLAMIPSPWIFVV